MLLAVLYAFCLAVGFLTGATGVGGVLVPPALVLLSGLETHTAMGTSLAAMFFLTLLGTWMFWRLGLIRWREALPLVLGGGLAGWPGAWCNARLDAGPLIYILGAVIVLAGLCALRPPTARDKGNLFWHGKAGLFGIGAATGFVAGLTGVGGGVLSVPWMIIVGYAPLTAVALSMPFQVLATLSGSLANVTGGYLDYNLLPGVTLACLFGFWRGVAAARRMSPLLLRRAIGVVCCALGGFLLVRQLMS